jgi:hypothetical protein
MMGCRREWEGGREEEGNSDHVFYSLALQCIDALVDYMGSWGVLCSDVSAIRKIQSMVRKNLNN